MPDIVFFILVPVFIAAVFLIIGWRAVRDSRRVRAPHGQQTATFRGGIWRPGKLDADEGTARLEFFDWGIRLGSSGLVKLASLGLARFLMPVWEARYEELTEARLMTAPGHHGVRLRVAGSADPVMFWTSQGSDVLDRLQEHAVSVDRAADQVPDPPPSRSVLD